jgi:hypothetical protein
MSDPSQPPHAPDQILDTIRVQSKALAELARRVDDDVAYMLEVVVKLIDQRRGNEPARGRKLKDW